MKTNRILTLKNRQLRRQSQGGYTLMEIMLVLAIIAILLSAGIFYMVGNIDVARSTRVRGDIQTLTVQLRTYEMQNMYMPTTDQGLMALVVMPTTEPKPRRWSQLMQRDGLLDPWGEPYQYDNPGKHNTTGFDLYSKGPDRQAGTADDIGNWEDTTNTTGN